MSNRLDTQKDKRKTKRYTRNSRVIIFLLLLCIMSFGVMSGMLYAEYEQTESWAGSELDQKLAHIPPEFAQNTYALGVLDDISMLGQTADILSVIDEHAGLTETTINDAKDVANITSTLLKEHGIESGNSVQSLERLQLYIDIYHIEHSIYETLDTDSLSQVMTQLQQRVLYGENDADTQALVRLQAIVNELNALNAFIDTHHAPLGEIVDSTMIVPTTMTRDITDTILSHIEEQSLTKFAVIQKLVKVIQSPTWTRILVNNNVLRDIDHWDREWAAYSTLNKDQYRRVGVHTTLNDVQNIDWITVQGVNPKPYQTVLGHSVVSQLTVNGESVTHGQYVKKGLSLHAHIEPVYQSAGLPEIRDLPEFTNAQDYASLADTLTDLLNKRDTQLEEERLEHERLEEERLEQERLEQERLEDEPSDDDIENETDASEPPTNQNR